MIDTMPRPRPPHLVRQVTQHGRVCWYVRKRRGKRIRIRAEYGTDAFWEEYRTALGHAAPTRPPAARTLAWALDRYRASPAWAKLAGAVRRQRESIFHSVIATAGEDAITAVAGTDIRAGRDRRSETPHAANSFLKAMRGFFKWAAGDGGLIAADPTVGVRYLPGKNPDGFHTWTDDEISRFESYWPLGTRERLALDLLTFTGLACSDVVRLGRQHVTGGVITMRMVKHRGDGVVYPPVLPVLRHTIECSPTGDLTFLVAENGRAFNARWFSTWFRRAARKAGCPGSAHGLRKAGATRAAENSATVHQLMALFGWKTERMALHYTRKADRRRLAASAGTLLERNADKSALTSEPGEGLKSNNEVKSGG